MWGYPKFKAGDTMRMVACRGVPFVTEGAHYVCLYGLESGIFADRPYVSFHDDRGQRVSCHANRFEQVL